MSDRRDAVRAAAGAQLALLNLAVKLEKHSPHRDNAYVQGFIKLLQDEAAEYGRVVTLYASDEGDD